MIETSRQYEKVGILKLQKERVIIQKKTFTKWINSHLKMVGKAVEDLFVDLADGKILLTLMEILSGQHLGKPNRGVLRVQKIENVNIALKFIQSKVTLENIGAEDIVDGNPRLILGLIWTIILRFQIQEMMTEGEKESVDKRSAKESLMLWCQQRTRGYKNVNVKDFSRSWQNGMAFNALVHSHRPDLIDFDNIVPEEHQKNLTQAFTIAENELGVPRLLDPEDVDVDRPDDKSILTYVSSLYLTFAKIKNENTSVKRVGKIILNALEVSKMIEDYEALVKELVRWIHNKITELNNRNFPNSLASMQRDMQKFKEYLTVDKRTKFVDRAAIDEKLFQIIVKEKQYQMKSYIPPEGLLLKDVEVAWNNLEKAEHERELALRTELVRQERLEQAAEKFIKKASLRDSWLNEKFKNLSDIAIGSSTQNIEGQINKEELIRNEIATSRERFQKLDDMVQTLDNDNYHDKEFISKKNSDIQRRWQELQISMKNKQLIAEKLVPLRVLMKNINLMKLELDDLQPQIQSTEFGKHLMTAEDLIERHNLLDRQLTMLYDRFKKLEFKSEDLLKSPKAEALNKDEKEALEKELLNLKCIINDSLKMSQSRKELLLQNCNFLKLWSNLESEEVWLTNEMKLLAPVSPYSDIISVLREIRRHQVYESEIDLHRSILDKLKQSATNLMDVYPMSAIDIQGRIETLSNGWRDLEEVKIQRRTLLKDSYECQKYYADVDDAERWIAEHLPLVLNNEYGADVGTSTALTKRQNAVYEKIVTFGKNDIQRLNELATLMTKPFESHNIRPDQVANKLSTLTSIDEGVNVSKNMILISVEENENDLVDNGVFGFTTDDKENDDISVNKLASNKMSRPKLSYQKSISKKLVQRWVSLDSDQAQNYISRENRKAVNEYIFNGPQIRNASDLHYDKVNIVKAQDKINSKYRNLVALSKVRTLNLNGTIFCHRFFAECNAFEPWMNDKKAAFNERESIGYDIEGVKQKYETLIRDLATNFGRISDIAEIVEEIVNISEASNVEAAELSAEQLSGISFPVNKDEIKQYYNEIKIKWDQLNMLKCEKERSLEGVSSIEIFNKTYVEIVESIDQKLDVLGDENVGFDKKSNEDLQRILHSLWTEIENIEKKIGNLKYLGDGVKSTYPMEVTYVDNKMDDIEEQQKRLQNAVNKRRSNLKDSYNVYKGLEEARDIDDRLRTICEQFENAIIPKDIQSTENCIHRHQSLKNLIEASETSLQNLIELANEGNADGPKNIKLSKSIDKLNEKIAYLREKENERVNNLSNLLNAQKLYKECEQMELLIAQQGCKVDAIDPQENVADVERCLKIHDGMSTMISQLDNRLQSLLKHADNLNSSDNAYDIKLLEKTKHLEDKMKNLQKISDQKKLYLEKELEFAQFKESSDELNEWIEDKMILIFEDNYKDLHNLDKKLQRHKSLEAEIQTNISALEEISRHGIGLVSKGHPKITKIKDIINNLSEKWKNLELTTDDKEKKILQALDQTDFNEDLNQIVRNADAIKIAIKSTPISNDLSTSKNLLSKRHSMEMELSREKEKLDRLKNKADEMIKDGHFNTDRILDDIERMEMSLLKLDKAVKQENEDLQTKLTYHEFLFHIQEELKWIEERCLLNSKNDCRRSLDEAVKLAIKHKKFINELNNHKSSIDSLLDHGSKLKNGICAEYSEDLESKCQRLTDAWKTIEQQAERYRQKLQLTEEGWHLFNDCNEIDSWIFTKSYYVNQEDHNMDIDHMMNKIAKLKAINIDFGTYDTLLKEVDFRIKTFSMKCNENHLLLELIEGIERKFNDVSEKLYFLQDSLNTKQKYLEDSRDYVTYKVEVEELQSCIDENFSLAERNEYGIDLQEMNDLKDRWNKQLITISTLNDRISFINKVAGEMLKKPSLYSKEIEGLQTDINQDWSRLIEYSDKKSSAFEYAEEIHRLNQMCKELSELIDQKSSYLSPIHCKDRNLLNKFVKKHEILEYELDNIELQVNNMKSVADKLKEDYPDNNIGVPVEMFHLDEKWDKLRELSDKRLAELKDSQGSLDLMDEMKLAGELFTEINMEIKPERNIRTVLAAEEQLKLGKEFQNKFHKNEDYYIAIISSAEEMIRNSTCSNTLEIQKEVAKLLQDKQDIQNKLNEWVQKSENNLIELKLLRDIEKVNSSTSLQEAKINGDIESLDLEETQRLINGNKNLSYTISKTEDQLESIVEYVEKLLAIDDFDSERVRDALDHCRERRRQLKDHFGKIEANLLDQLGFLNFLRETDYLKLWIEEKLQQIKTLDTTTDNMKDRVLLLQKYNEYEAEVMVNQMEFERLGNIVQDYIDNSHGKANEVDEIFGNITQLWKKLLSECHLRSTALKETQDILFLLDELDAVEVWIREKKLLVSAGDTGTDLDHCQFLRNKLKEPVRGKQINDERISMLKSRVEDLMNKKTIPQSEADSVKDRSISIEEKWNILKLQIKVYEKVLEEAYRMHSHYTELCMLEDQINDRLKKIKVNDFGSDISTVDILRRKHEAIDRDILVLKEKFQGLKDKEIFSDNFDAVHVMKMLLKQKEIGEILNILTSMAAQRWDLLSLSQRYFNTNSDASMLMECANKYNQMINTATLPTRAATVREALETHDLLLKEIKTKKMKENRVTDLIYKLKIDRDLMQDKISNNSISIVPSEEQVVFMQQQLSQSYIEIQRLWKSRHDYLKEYLDLYTFIECCEAEEQWILVQEETATSLTDAKAKHTKDINERIETKLSIDLLTSNREKETIKGSLMKSLQILHENNIKAVTLADEKYNDLLAKFDHYKENLAKIQHTLIAEKQFYDLSQRVSDHISWIRKKGLIATDNNYEDKINLVSKIKQQKEFMSEMKANEPDIYSTVDYGKRLINEGSIYALDIEDKVSELESCWRNLLSLGDLKLTRLTDANEQLLWSFKVDEFISWLDDVEDILGSQEYGEDLVSVEIAKKKHKNIETDIAFHKEVIKTLQDQAYTMINEYNYYSEEIKDKEELITIRFQKLTESLNVHALNLAESESVYKFSSDINFEIDWIKDKMLLTNKTELGSNLPDALRYEKQHHSMMSDIKDRERVIDTLIEKGHGLENRLQYDVDKIRQMYKNLSTDYRNLCNSYEKRATELKENLFYQEFDCRISDCNLRISDKMYALNNLGYGKNEETCQHLIQKIDGYALEINSENNNFTNIQNSFEELSSRYQAQAKESLKQLKEKLNEVGEMMITRRNLLVENLKYHQFIRDSDEIKEWIKTKSTLALIEDYGNDYDECLRLIDKHTTYNQSINSNISNITLTKSYAKQLISERNPFSEEIQQTLNDINDSMAELRENLKVRKEALQGALEVHTYSKESDDLLDWITNKNIEVSSFKETTEIKYDCYETNDFLQPLSVLLKIENNFTKFQRDLEAVSNQIRRLNNESIRLQGKYPDAVDHISEKKDQVECEWNKLNIAVKERKDRISEWKAFQSWLTQYNDLFNWAMILNEKVRSERFLPLDVDGAERLVISNNGHFLDIENKSHQLNQLMSIVNEIKVTVPYIAPILEEKQEVLMKSWNQLVEDIQFRRSLYEDNLDLRKFLFDLQHLERWITTNEAKMKTVDENFFKNIAESEEALRNHEDFMKYIVAEQEQVAAVNRSTKLEERFRQRLALESKDTDSILSEVIKTNPKRQDTQMILDERCRDVNRRNAQNALRKSNSERIIRPNVPEVKDSRNRFECVNPSPNNLKVIDLYKDDQIKSSELLLPKDAKPIRKLSSFSTRRRDSTKDGSLTTSTQSLSNTSNHMSCLILKQQIKTTKGIKASVSAWKQYFTVLEGSTLQFYKNKKAYETQPNYSLFSYDILDAEVSNAKYNPKDAFNIHMRLKDQSEFYLQFKDQSEMKQWLINLRENAKCLFENSKKSVKSNGSPENNVSSKSPPAPVTCVVIPDIRRISTSSCEDDSDKYPLKSPLSSKSNSNSKHIIKNDRQRQSTDASDET